MNDTKTKRLTLNGLHELMDMQKDINLAPGSEAERNYKYASENLKLVFEVSQQTGKITLVEVNTEGGPRG